MRYHFKPSFIIRLLIRRHYHGSRNILGKKDGNHIYLGAAEKQFIC
jgi:hypothetical protein